MLTPFFGEFLGTFVLIVLGGGVNAGVSLKGTLSEGSDWMVTTAGWAFAVFSGVLTATASGSPGAHLNPAVTIAVAIKTGDFHHVVSFIAAQFLGAMLGAGVVWLFFYPHWALTPDPARKLGVFCTAPAIRHPLSNLFCEVVATAILLLVIGAIGSKLFAAAGPAPGLAPYLVGIVVWGVGLALGGTTGYALNPARDLGPRIMHALLPIAGKGDSDWTYAPIPVIGPILGAILTGLFLRFAGI